MRRSSEKLPDDRTLSSLYLEKGFTQAQIGDRYGVSRQRVQQRLGRLGIGRKRLTQLLDPERLRSLFIDSWLSRKDIAEELHVTELNVRQELKRHGIQRPRKVARYLTPQIRATIRDLYVIQGYTQAETAAELGLTVDTFRTLLKLLGITFRHSPGRHPTAELKPAELRRLYIDEHHSCNSIARSLGCDWATIDRHLRALGLKP